MNLQELLRHRLVPHLNNLFAFVFAIILLFLVIGILVGAGKLFLQLGTLFSSGKITGSYLQIISDVLSLFILVELSRSLVDYFEQKRLRIVYILDAGIVFILREVMIGLFQHKTSPPELYAISAVLFVLGALRIAMALVHQREHSVTAQAHSKSTE